MLWLGINTDLLISYLHQLPHLPPTIQAASFPGDKYNPIVYTHHLCLLSLFSVSSSIKKILACDCNAAARSLQLCPTLYDPIYGSPSGSPIPGILQCMKVKSES